MPINDMHDRSWTRSLRARNLSPRTIATYLEGTQALRRHVADKDLAEVTPDELRGFFAYLTESRSASTSATRFRSLQQFYKWALLEEVVDVDPMVRLSPPMIPDKTVNVLSLDQVGVLLDTCKGKSFEQRRDQAMIRLFLEPGGPRLSELTFLTVAAVDLDRDLVSVQGKGRRERGIPFGSRTGQALERYLRARARHPLVKKDADLAPLWLGKKGGLTTSGVRQMMRRRAATAGLGGLHPHMLRHTAAHEWLDAGGSETDALRLFGWNSRQMLERYGASVATQRAQDSARRLGLGDRY